MISDFEELIEIPSICSVLIEYLSYVQIRQLREIYPLFITITNKKPYSYNESKASDSPLAINFPSIIKRNLSKLIPDVDNFLEALVNSRGVISGSFILQCLIGEEYDRSDIDIYHMKQGNGCLKFQIIHNCEFYKYMIKEYIPSLGRNGYINQMVDISYFYIHPDIYDGKYSDETVQSFRRKRPVIANKTSEKKYKGVINSMTIHGRDLKDKICYRNVFDYIDRVFDISICKVGYQPSSGEIFIADFNGLTTKTGTYKTRSILVERDFGIPHMYNKASLKIILDKRVKKYTDRGFTLKDLEPVGDITEKPNIIRSRSGLPLEISEADF